MTKKVILLAGLLVFLMACVVTSPTEMFQTTPTMCVECVQATICAENQTGDTCPFEKTEKPEDGNSTPTIEPTRMEEFTRTSVSDMTAEPTRTEISSPTIEPTQTEVPLQTATKTPSAATPQPVTSIPLVANAVSDLQIPEIATPTVYLTQTGDWLYKAQTGSPKYMKNFAHPKLSCSWSGIAGQVFGPGEVPQPDVVVVVSGDANGTPVEEMGYTGSAPDYGESGYEIVFPTGPVNSTDSMMIQLLDVQGNELSMRYVFDTYIDCKKALIIYNFVLAK